VLRLSSDRALIALAPDSLALLRVAGVSHPRVSESRAVACDPGPVTELWQGAVAALGRLAEEIRNADVRVTVVLSNHFARFILVPWSQSLGNAEEETAFVRYRFAKVHGERSKDWEVRLSPAPTGSTRIASAVDSSLVQAVCAAFPAGVKAKLVSVQPYLMAAFNRWRKHIKAERAWFLLVEPQRACVARLEHGLWSAVRNARGNFDEPSQWAGLLERERHLVGGEGASDGVYVHAPRSPKPPSTAVQGWTFKTLALAPAEGLLPAQSVPFAMALCAL
jgi:hypothetical protein